MNTLLCPNSNSNPNSASASETYAFPTLLDAKDIESPNLPQVFKVFHPPFVKNVVELFCANTDFSRLLVLALKEPLASAPDNKLPLQKSLSILFSPGTGIRLSGALAAWHYAKLDLLPTDLQVVHTAHFQTMLPQHSGNFAPSVVNHYYLTASVSDSLIDEALSSPANKIENALYQLEALSVEDEVSLDAFLKPYDLTFYSWIWGQRSLASQ